MKTIIFALSTLFTLNAFATVDAQTEVYIVVGSYHEESEYMVQKVPASFCLGELTSALTQAITQPVIIKSNYGCGSMMVYDEQINAATCAAISPSNTVYPEIDNSNWEVQARTDIRVSLSACGDRANDEAFARAVTEAVYKTFNENGIQINKFVQD